jgi:glycosyltransferase involved in cell wall biosynthesis
MKVLIWTQYFWPENFAINEVAEELVAQGVEVIVLTGKPNYPSGKIQTGYTIRGLVREMYGDIRVLRIPLIPRNNGSALHLALNYLSFVASGFLFAPYALRSEKFDAILVYAPSPLIQALPAIFLSSIKRTPIALWVQDLWPDALKATGYVTKSILLELVGSVVNLIYKTVDLILIQSEAFRIPIENRSGKPDRIKYHPNSVAVQNMKTVNFDSIAGTLGELENHFSVVFAGNIGKAQACHVILEAARRIADTRIKFFLIGDGSMAATLANEVIKSGLSNVVFIDRIASDLMPEIFSRASALLVTLARDAQLSRTVPSKLMAYLAAAKPIVACTDGETAKIVLASGGGLICRAEDSSQLAEVILKLRAMPIDEQKDLGCNARKYFEENFSLESKTRELVKMLKELR